MIIYYTDEEEKIAQGLAASMVKHALDLDGTCTGEHGIGIGKRKYLVEELGESTVELMKYIKQCIDPLNLFNPGKVRRRHGRLSNELTGSCSCTLSRRTQELKLVYYA